MLQKTLPFEELRRLPKRPLRRRVFRLHLDPLEDGTYVFKARSFTRARGLTYRCRVNPRTGYVWCSCRDFRFRKDSLHPTMWNGPVCKHLERAIRTVRKVEREAAVAPQRVAYVA